jgi:hypothetical protein
MSSYFQVFAQVYPGQCNRVIVWTHIFKEDAPALPAPSLVSFGNFHILRRCFPTPEQAEQWAGYLRSTFIQDPAHNPIMDGGQLYLFQEVSS